MQAGGNRRDAMREQPTIEEPVPVLGRADFVGDSLGLSRQAAATVEAAGGWAAD